MAYRLESGESVARGVVRVVCEQLGGARAYLLSTDQPEAERVHEFRKCLKKVRGAVRLVRPVLGEVAYHKLNTWARDTAREFAHLRDADAMLETLARLGIRYGGARAMRRSFRAAERIFSDRREAIQMGPRRLADLTPRALRGLDDVMGHVRRYRPMDSGFQTVSGGLARTYGRGHRAFRAAYADPTPERFHEWRKRVKHHWYHIRLLESVWPAIMGTRRTTLDHLGELLGEHHDLAVLRDRVETDWVQFEKGGSVLSLVEATDMRQAEIYEEARLVGRRLYLEAPQRFVGRMGDYWRAARSRELGEPRLPRGGSGSIQSARRTRVRGSARGSR